MNVTLINPITISLSSAKLVVESDNRGTIEFLLLDQPVRLNILSSEYIYNTTIAINDRIKTLENFSTLSQNSQGTVLEIIPDRTEDRVKVLFDKIIPDQVINSVDAHVNSAVTSLIIEVPLRIVEKI